MKDLKEYLIQETIVMTRQGIPSNADYVVYAINVGKIKKDGKTKSVWVCCSICASIAHIHLQRMISLTYQTLPKCL